MMSRCSCATVAVVLSLCMGPRAISASADDALTRSLSAAIDIWCRNVEFVCTFELLEGEASSIEDARAERFATSPTRATGIFAKQGDLVRIAHDFGQPPVQLDDLHVRNVSRDSVRKGEMVVNHTPGYGATPRDDSIIVTHHPRVSQPWLPVAGPGTGTHLSPFVLLGNPNAINPISYLEGRGYTIASTPVGEDQAEVEIIDSDGYGKITLTLCLQSEIPVITRLVQVNESRGLYGEVHLEDFVQVRGGRVASTVRVVSPRGPDQCSLRVWRSEDLGKREPAHEDFLVQVPEECRVRCVVPESIPEAVGGIRTFDVTRFTLDDIITDCYVPQLAPPLGSSSRRPWRLLPLIGMALGAAWWTAVLYKRRKWGAVPEAR